MLHTSPPYLFDVHTHLQFAAYLQDRGIIIKNTLAENIWMVNVGTQYETSLVALHLAERYAEGVYAAVGLHPSHTGQSHLDPQEFEDMKKAREFTNIGEVFDYEAYKNLAIHPKVVAIGECGLDYFRVNDESAYKKQKEVFEAHQALSKDTRKPLMIHCRNAFPDLIQMLESKRHDLDNPGIVHFFSGTVDDAKHFLDLGFSFSFGGVITFARDYDEQIKYIPFDRILLETDAPYVAPAPYRGKRNEPRYIVETAKKIAELKNISPEEAAVQTVMNAKTLFSL